MNPMKNIVQAMLLLAAFWAIESYSFAQNCQCHLCENPQSQRTPEQRRYWNRIAGQSRSEMPGPNNVLGREQVVFLDFDSGDDGDFDYTPALRDAIQAQLEVIYQQFSVIFIQSNPGGQFSTIVFNEGVLGGLAEDIDFRNQNRSDNAVLNLAGAGFTTEADIVAANAFIAAHELGHLLGLRHADSYGPIGEGILAGFGLFYSPAYQGPMNAFESEDHIMATPALGIFLNLGLTFLSERSSVKLMFAEVGQTTLDIENNDSIANAQEITLQNQDVPNTIVDGQNASMFGFSVSSAVVEGTLDGMADPQDVFQFEAKAGDLFNMELLSNVPDILAVDPIDPNISVFDSTGAFVDYFGADAFNESELKTPDAILIDLIIPADGTYFVQVGSSFSDSGNYELLVYRFNGIRGDVNCDGTVDLLDIGPFVDAILSGDNTPKADINNDNVVDLLDIGSLVDLLKFN